jgi:transcription initiation factor IIE alpha subunit
MSTIDDQPDNYEPAPQEVQVLSPPKAVDALVRLVIRAFYEQDHCVIMDALLKWAPITDVELARRLNLQPKFVKSKLVELRNEYLVQSTAEQVKKSSRQTLEIVSFFVDFKLFIDTVNYRFHRLRQEIKAAQQTQEVYLCRNCGFEYTGFDIINLLDPMSGMLVCSHCGTGEVDQGEQGSADDAAGTTEAKMERDLRRILDLLKLADGYVVPLSTRSLAYTIITKFEAQTKSYEDQQQMRVLENMGAHAHRNMSSSVGALGGSGTGNSGMGSGHSLLGDLSVNVVVETDNVEKSSEAENLKKALKRKQDKKKEVTPYFLKRAQGTDETIVQSLNIGPKTAVMSFDGGELLPSDNEPPTKKRKHDTSDINEEVYAELQMYHQSKQDDDDTAMNDAAMRNAESASEWDNVTVLVQGVPKKISEITEEDKQAMTAEEYSTYANMFATTDDNDYY